MLGRRPIASPNSVAKRCNRKANQKGRSTAVHGPAEHVPPHLVGAEWMRSARWLQPRQRFKDDRIANQQRRRNRGQHESDQDGRSSDDKTVPACKLDQKVRSRPSGAHKRLHYGPGVGGHDG